MPTIEVSNLGASYGAEPVLQDITLEFGNGEMLAVLGPSGCGKTTLLRSIAGLHRIDSGSISLGGITVEDADGIHVPPERRKVGLMPQEGGLFPHLSVRRNIEFGLRGPASWTLFPHVYFADRAGRARRVAEMLELVGLPDAADARPSELSGGQQQRVALARALAPAPAVVLMDEPFAALDSGLRAGIREDVRELLRASNTPSILVTHDRSEALGTADKIAVLLDRRCVQVGTPRQIYDRPLSQQVASFVGDAQFVDAVAVAGTIETVLGQLESTASEDGTGQALIRPEQLTVTENLDGDFFVEHEVFTGPRSSITVRHRASGLTLSTVVHPHLQLRPGVAVDIRVLGAVHYFPNRSAQT